MKEGGSKKMIRQLLAGGVRRAPTNDSIFIPEQAPAGFVWRSSPFFETSEG